MFVISQPSTSQVVIGKLVAGQLVPVAAAGGNPVTLASECLLDSFSVTNPGGNAPPVICGTNSNEHSK